MTNSLKKLYIATLAIMLLATYGCSNNNNPEPKVAKSIVTTSSNSGTKDQEISKSKTDKMKWGDDSWNEKKWG